MDALLHRFKRRLTTDDVGKEEPETVSPFSSTLPRIMQISGVQLGGIDEVDHAQNDGDEFSHEIVLKVVVLGGTGSGKTSIVRRIIQDVYTHKHIPTIGVDVHSCWWTPTPPPKTPVRLEIWDVAHQELRGTHKKRILRGVDCAIVVFDPRDRASIRAVDDWRRALEIEILSQRMARSQATTSAMRKGGTKKKKKRRETQTNHLTVADRPQLMLFAHKSDQYAEQIDIMKHDLSAYSAKGGYTAWHFTSALDSGVSIIDIGDSMVNAAVKVYNDAVNEHSRRATARAERRKRHDGDNNEKDEDDTSLHRSASADNLATMPKSEPPRRLWRAMSVADVQVPLDLSSGRVEGTIESPAMPPPIPKQQSNKSIRRMALLRNRAKGFFDWLDAELQYLANVLQAHRAADLSLLHAQAAQERTAYMALLDGVDKGVVSDRPSSVIPVRRQEEEEEKGWVSDGEVDRDERRTVFFSTSLSPSTAPRRRRRTAARDKSQWTIDRARLILADHVAKWKWSLESLCVEHAVSDDAGTKAHTRPPLLLDAAPADDVPVPTPSNWGHWKAMEMFGELSGSLFDQVNENRDKRKVRMGFSFSDAIEEEEEEEEERHSATLPLNITQKNVDMPAKRGEWVSGEVIETPVDAPSVLFPRRPPLPPHRERQGSMTKGEWRVGEEDVE